MVYALGVGIAFAWLAAKGEANEELERKGKGTQAKQPIGLVEARNPLLAPGQGALKGQGPPGGT
jgi:hypothetical protein